MATLNAIADAIGAQLRTIDDVYVFDRWEGSLHYPALLVLPPDEVRYHEAMSPTAARFKPLPFTVLALVGSLEDGLAGYRQRDLNDLADFTGTRSVRAAIEADRTLGSVVGDCVVESFALAGPEEVAQIGYWAGRFTLKVQGVA